MDWKIFALDNAEVVHENPSSWGPVGDTQDIGDIPYLPYSKCDKLGRVADWLGTSENKAKGKGQAYGAGSSSIFGYQHQEDEESFSIVAAAKRVSARPQISKFGKNYAQHKQTGSTVRTNSYQNLSNNRRQAPNSRKWNASWKDFKPTRLRDSSVSVGSDWKVIEEIEFSRLAKLQYGPEDPSTVTSCGQLHYYDKTFDKVNVKAEKLLQVYPKFAMFPSTYQDPTIKRLMNENVGKVYGTDVIFSIIMASPKSFYPWDILIRKEDGKLIFDSRSDCNVELLTVNETASEPPPENDPGNINSVNALSVEATAINKNFLQQILKDDSSIRLQSPCPFYSDKVGFNYKKWNFGDYDVIVRSQVDGVLKNDSDFFTVKCMNEYDPKLTIDWKQKLDSQRGAIFASELKNNSNKISKWGFQAVLGDIENIKLGYITRVNPRDRNKHVVLGVQTFSTDDFASQISLNVTNGFGILKAIIDLCWKLADGKYVFMKDPNRPILRLYSVPKNSFEEEIKIDEE